MKVDAELVPYGSAVTKDSEDPFDLGAVDRSKSLIVDDCRVTQRLETVCRGSEPSKAVDGVMKTEATEEILVQTGKPVMTKEQRKLVRGRLQDIESRNSGGHHTPKLELNSSNSLASLPPGKQNVRLLFTNKGVWLADTLIPRRGRTPSFIPRGLRTGRKSRRKIHLSYH